MRNNMRQDTSERAPRNSAIASCQISHKRCTTLNAYRQWLSLPQSEAVASDWPLRLQAAAPHVQLPIGAGNASADKAYFCQVRFLWRWARSFLRRLCLLIFALRRFFSEPIDVRDWGDGVMGCWMPLSGP